MGLRELLEQLNNLKRMPRTGWLLCGVSLEGVEDVAQHSFEVATIAMLIADELRRGGEKLDRDRAICIALLHDWAEAEVADFPYTALKHLGSPGTKQHMEQSALEELLEGIPKKANYLALWREYKDKRTPESRLVHAADYLSMLVQAIKYQEQGISSRELCELWRAVRKDLASYAREFKPVRELVVELEKHFSTRRIPFKYIG